MKDDEQARNADVPIWLALKYKYDKYAPIVEPCTVDAFRNKDHKDHNDDDARLEEESSAKRNQEEKVEFDAWDNKQGTYNDEVPSKEVSPKLIDEMIGNEIPTNGNYETRKYVLPLHKYHAVPFDLEERNTQWYDQGYGQKFIKEIVVKRADSEYSHFLESDYKYLHKDDIKDISYVIWERVHDYQLGLESYQQKVNITAPTLTFPGIEKENPLTITSDPLLVLIYETTRRKRGLW
ncbi:hypothetical protein Tco_0789372, partial [Tanacetum coccineum]